MFRDPGGSVDTDVAVFFVSYMFLAGALGSRHPFTLSISIDLFILSIAMPHASPR